jgi:hypothetical protein
MQELTVICVLRSGGIYGPNDVAKLQHNVAQKLSLPHRFVCLSDIQVPCERIAMQHNWPGWWAKIELFRPGVISGPTIYLDLDNVVLADFAEITQCGHDFALMQNLSRPHMVSSAVMWHYHNAPQIVYEKFVVSPQHWVKYHQDNRSGPYLGDQAFIWDALNRDVPVLETEKYGICSYRLHVKDQGKPPDWCKIVCFGGKYKPNNVNADWLRAIRG